MKMIGTSGPMRKICSAISAPEWGMTTSVKDQIDLMQMPQEYRETHPSHRKPSFRKKPRHKVRIAGSSSTTRIVAYRLT
jgi:hypothetical protein